MTTPEPISKPTSVLVGPNRPTLEKWPDGAVAIEMLGLGYTDVHTYQWSGGMLSGWVEFDDGPNPRRVNLDLDRLIAKEERVGAKEYSGKVIVAHRPVADPAAGKEAWVWVRLEWDMLIPEESRKLHQSRTKFYHGSWKPRGDSTAEIMDGPTVALHSRPVGLPPSAAFQWLELRVESDSKHE